MNCQQLQQLYVVKGYCTEPSDMFKIKWCVYNIDWVVVCFQFKKAYSWSHQAGRLQKHPKNRHNWTSYIYTVTGTELYHHQEWSPSCCLWRSQFSRYLPPRWTRRSAWHRRRRVKCYYPLWWFGRSSSLHYKEIPRDWIHPLDVLRSLSEQLQYLSKEVCTF